MDSTQMKMIRQFHHELLKESPSLDLLALYIARIAYPDLKITQYLAKLDQLADEIDVKLAAIGPGKERAERFLYIFRNDLGFDGNRDAYYDPRNSFLNEVLDRRVGLPIMLCILCMSIGRRTGLAIQGMGFPGHFMASYKDEAGEWLLDPFNGTVLSVMEISSYLSTMFQEPVKLSADMLQPTPIRLLILRVLNNLRQIYLQEQSLEMAVQVLDYILVITPSTAAFWQERGVLHHHLQEWERAIRDFRRYFFLQDQSMMARGLHSNDAYEEDVNSLSEPELHLLGMLRHAEEMRLRLN